MQRGVHAELAKLLCIPFCAWPHFRAISLRYSVPRETLFSIYSQDCQQRVKASSYRVQQSIATYCCRYQSGADILDLAAELDVAPCSLLRQLLLRLPWGLQRERITKVLRDPTCLANLVRPEAGEQAQLAAGLDRMQHDVVRCVEADQVCSPASDLIRHTMGVEYEVVLCRKLREVDIAFWSEDDLRDKGFHKTPDVKLQVPVAVRGRIINWIDSKATFGDERTHRHLIENQFDKYVNRYGPGAVIYWFGHVVDLDSDDVLVLAGFPLPADITTLPRLPLPA
ncbi:hypothetical protein WJX72_009813 [[Myrmecia] bisecta]|uniref:CDAN1-interacting nuclease 1 n=1 Tax=[Myrmecia] bisecta TaxID=41462 RepID=A0AAW1PEB2_9CHLO